jgi:hypothetical protein
METGARSLPPEQPIASGAADPDTLVARLREQLRVIGERTTAEQNTRLRAHAQPGSPDPFECAVQADGRVTVRDVPHNAALLVEVSSEDLAINIVSAMDGHANRGYPKQVPLRVAVTDQGALLLTQTTGERPDAVLAQALSEFFDANNS